MIRSATSITLLSEKITGVLNLEVKVGDPNNPKRALSISTLSLEPPKGMEMDAFLEELRGLNPLMDGPIARFQQIRQQSMPRPGNDLAA
jgi:hypothetical protein